MQYRPGGRVLFLAVMFEGALALAGVSLAYETGVPVVGRFQIDANVLLRTVLATAPLLAFLWLGMRVQWPPLAKLRRLVERMVADLSHQATWRGLAVISLAAGIGEELLFRGALQPLAIRFFGVGVGILLVSALFGALHAASRLYFIIATVVGLYFGWLAWRFDDLVTPIAVHAIYDYAALVAITRAMAARSDSLVKKPAGGC